MRFLHAFLNWWRDHSVISLIVTGGALAGAIPKYIEIATRIVKWNQKRKRAEICRYFPQSDEDWQRVIDVRYGFAFSYPCSWQRVTSDNQDGHTVRHPEIQSVEIRGWGCHSSVSRGPEDWLKHECLSYSEVSIPRRERANVEERVDGDRVVFNEGSTRIMEIHTEMDGRFVGIRCCSPIKFFATCEPVFLRACHSLALLKPADV